MIQGLDRKLLENLPFEPVRLRTLRGQGEVAVLRFGTERDEQRPAVICQDSPQLGAALVYRPAEKGRKAHPMCDCIDNIFSKLPKGQGGHIPGVNGLAVEEGKEV
jgi:hypothetical protein